MASRASSAVSSSKLLPGHHALQWRFTAAQWCQWQGWLGADVLQDLKLAWERMWLVAMLLASRLPVWSALASVASPPLGLERP